MPSSLIKPPFLAPGDLVGIVSPAYTPNSQKVDAGIRYLESSGLRVKTGKSLLASHGPFAGDDSARIADLNGMIADREVKAIFASRGGYGVSRIIDSARFSMLKRSPKWIVGYSDITVMHLWLNNITGIASLHAEMPVNYGNAAKTGETLQTLKDALFGNRLEIKWEGESLRTSEARGVVTGGNLSLLYSMAGSKAFPSLRGKILFIEDIGEKIYHLDRMMVALKLSGALKGLSALVVGGLNEMEDTSVPWRMTPEETVAAAVKGFDFPVYFNFPAGHINDNRAVFMGLEAVLRPGKGVYTLQYVE